MPKGKRGPRPEAREDETKLTITVQGHEPIETTAAQLTKMADQMAEAPATDKSGFGRVESEQVSALFKEAKLLRDKEGHQLVRADFVIVVSDMNAGLLPKGIRAEWKGMKAERLLTEVSLDGKKLPVQVVEARMWPDKPKMKFFQAVGRLEKVRLTECAEKNTTWIELRVSITRGKDADLWNWLSDNYPGQSVWLKFEDAQGVLLEEFLEEEGAD